ncbi:hypothetical protein U1Q18_016170, partial [Sarracenia purpurea var. burkii]
TMDMETLSHLPVTAAQVGTYFVGQYYQGDGHGNAANPHTCHISPLHKNRNQDGAFP